MAIKAIMVDVDGVLVVSPDQRGWSVNLERDVGVSPAMLHTAFFERHWDDVVHGRASLRQRLAPVLHDIAPDVAYETLIDYWFANDAHVNYALLAERAAMRAGGTAVHLATVQEHERARYLWEELDFKSAFDGMHYAAELGSSKPAGSFYKSIEARTCLRPHELFFIDDKMANVEGAIRCGWAAELWTGRETLRSLLGDRPLAADPSSFGSTTAPAPSESRNQARPPSSRS